MLVAATLLALVASAVSASAAPRPPIRIIDRNVHHPLRLGPPASGGSSHGAVAAAAAPVGYIPCDVSGAYGLSRVTTGNGMVIAIVDAFDQPTIASDVHGFDAALGLPDPRLNVTKPFGQPGPSPAGTNWDLEITLDVEWAHVVAPGATIDLVEVLSPNFSLPVGQSAGDLTSGVFYATNTLDADVVSMSWGGGEPPDAATDAAADGYFPAVNGAGSPIQYVASSGDGGFGSSWPATSNHVLAVGGTSLTPGAFGYAAAPGSHTDCSGATQSPGVTSSNETVWGNQCSTSACIGSGGGPAAFEPKPAWQSSLTGSTRVTPDVAMLADPATGVALFFNGSWLSSPIGGTSLSAPMWAGITARLDEARHWTGRPRLNVTPNSSWPYTVSSFGPGVYNDVTQGSAPAVPNDPCVANQTCVAKVGYDEVTGLGSPHFDSILRDLVGVESLGGQLSSGPAVSTWASNRMDVFANTSGGLQQWTWNGSTWSTSTPLSALASNPAAVSWGPNRIDVFEKGSDRAMWHASFNGTSWSGWQSLGGGFNSGPAVASWTAGRLDVFGVGTDNELWHAAFGGGGWSVWEPLGGFLQLDPTAVSWAPNRIDVFGRGGDGALWHKVWGGSWSGWESLGGGLVSPPSVSSAGFNRLDVYVLGGDVRLWHKVWNGSSWVDWSSNGSGPWMTAGIGTIQRAGAQGVDVFTGGPDSALWHTSP